MKTNTEQFWKPILDKVPLHRHTATQRHNVFHHHFCCSLGANNFHIQSTQRGIRFVRLSRKKHTIQTWTIKQNMTNQKCLHPFTNEAVGQKATDDVTTTRRLPGHCKKNNFLSALAHLIHCSLKNFHFQLLSNATQTKHLFDRPECSRHKNERPRSVAQLVRGGIRKSVPSSCRQLQSTTPDIDMTTVQY